MILHFGYFDFHFADRTFFSHNASFFTYLELLKKKKQIHPAHNIRFNHDLQLDIDCIEWALKKIEVNKLPMDRLEAVTRVMIKDLEKRKD